MNVENQIIALWCHPRSMSTAVERLFRERGDLRCLHEPFMYPYYMADTNRNMPHFQPKEGYPATYAEVREKILNEAQSGSVFFKDMSYYILSHLESDPDFNQRLKHCFLIRNPRATIASYFDLDAEVTREEIGVEAQWNHFAFLRKGGLAPYVIQAEVVREDPRAALAKLWRYLKLDYKESAFSWGENHPVDWNPVKTWHSAAMGSSEISTRKPDEKRDEQLRFDRAAEKAPHLQDYLNHHLPYYQRLLEYTQ